MSAHAFESEVPPLNVRCGPISGSAKSSRKAQQTHKSFSMLAAGKRVLDSACSYAARWSSAGIRRKASMPQRFRSAS
jgi:hypothetical protein